MLSKGFTLVIISMMVFGVLNLIENIIHYSIGRIHSSESNLSYLIPVFFPSGNDLIKIFIIMIIFGLAQGLITEYFIKD